MRVGENIRRLRENAGMTIYDLGDRVGCTFSMIAQVERGGKNAPLGLAQQIAEVFGVTLDELVNGSGEGRP